ncbi:protoheme IX farnesyltransferase, mitochondrial [Andrographis paniculata]|uniref:protoheme IX farnesyltransferase, mitochondrial n=1 Tax=Andrographis paniculata TaxID=175694 RepID=UPI0021E8253E|nr:protoheme IX farnesyltransferase, mitochondrial [Andrographis paniculata]XP_051148098.1 protoheme IX farnesyltransferase, mitochondrial [Andrographis paniculata]
MAIWGRNSLTLSSKLVGISGNHSLIFLLRASRNSPNHGLLARSNCTRSEPSSAGNPVNWAQSGPEVPVYGPREASGSAIDLQSLAAASAVRVKEAADLAKHYGRCYWELSKARLSMLVVATSGTGYILGSGSSIDYLGLCCTCAGTMMVAAAANSLNQVFEVKNDAKMNRTRRRPLPAGRITIPHAVGWAASMGVGGTVLLASKANMMAASLAASNLVLYAFVYTPLKQIHPVNTWVGAIVGAIPPLLGWAAAAGEVSLNGMILPAALYFWQIPHFMALAYLCRKDYADGGFKMFSLTDTTGRRTALVALRNCLYLLPLGYLAYDWGITSGWFCAESTLLALAITLTAGSFYRNRTTEHARRMFHASLLYLPVFMGGLLLHRISDNELTLTGHNSNRVIDLSLSSEETKPVDQTQPQEKRRPSHNRQRPPVAYASVAPFPFLPAPSYIENY